MTSDEVEKMKRDAEAHADEDKQKRELIDARNKADSLIYQVEKTLQDAGDKMTEADKAPIHVGGREAEEGARTATT